jgi:hypothetical protein
MKRIMLGLLYGSVLACAMLGVLHARETTPQPPEQIYQPKSIERSTGCRKGTHVCYDCVERDEDGNCIKVVKRCCPDPKVEDTDILDQ